VAKSDGSGGGIAGPNVLKPAVGVTVVRCGGAGGSGWCVWGTLPVDGLPVRFRILVGEKGRAERGRQNACFSKERESSNIFCNGIYYGEGQRGHVLYCGKETRRLLWG